LKYERATGGRQMLVNQFEARMELRFLADEGEWNKWKKKEYAMLRAETILQNVVPQKSPL